MKLGQLAEMPTPGEKGTDLFKSQGKGADLFKLKFEGALNISLFFC